jgi:hypothetical protein
MRGEGFGVGAGWCQKASSALASLENSPRPSPGKGPSSSSALAASGAGFLGGLFCFAVPFVPARGMVCTAEVHTIQRASEGTKNRLAGWQAKTRQG